MEKFESDTFSLLNFRYCKCVFSCIDEELPKLPKITRISEYLIIFSHEICFLKVFNKYYTFNMHFVGYF